MNKKTILAIGFSLAFLAPVKFVSAADIVNGTFDSDLSGWATVENNGSAAWNSVDQTAELTTGEGVSLFSVMMIQGDDGSLTSFADPLDITADNDWLKFDAVFSLLDADSFESGGLVGSDYLEVAFYDSTNWWLLATVDATTLDTSFSIPMTGFQGLSVALSFELYDDDDGFNSKVVLDNIRFEGEPDPSPVPEPPVIWLLLTGAMAVLLRKRG